MREIKFRAWDKYGNTMRLVKSVNYADDGFAKTITVRLVDGIHYSYVHGESCELMQWTGLTDRNGKEIYEGDIVRCTDDCDEISELNSDTGIGQIKWATDGFWEVDELNNLLCNFFYCGYVETIGNIYENPELLEKA